jgi:hypothetical protein
MTWVPTNPGMEEARRLAWINFFGNYLGDLNTSLARTSPMDFYSRAGLVPITTAMIQSENSKTMFELSQMPLVIRYTNGDVLRSEDMTSQLFSIVSGNTGWNYEFTSHVYVYLHYDLFYNQNAQQQVADRGLCFDRIVDWMIGEINFWNPETMTGGTVLPLVSSVIGDPYDKLKDITVTETMRTLTAIDMGDNIFYPTLIAKIEANQQ